MRPYGYGEPTAAPGVNAIPASTGLQAVKRANGQLSAIIDGQSVRVGQKVGDATLISLSETAAVLKNAEGKRFTLRMFPDSNKTSTGARDKRSAAKGRE